MTNFDILVDQAVSQGFKEEADWLQMHRYADRLFEGEAMSFGGNTYQVSQAGMGNCWVFRRGEKVVGIATHKLSLLPCIYAYLKVKYVLVSGNMEISIDDVKYRLVMRSEYSPDRMDLYTLRPNGCPCFIRFVDNLQEAVDEVVFHMLGRPMVRADHSLG